MQIDLQLLAQVRRLAYGARGPPEARRELGVQPLFGLRGGGGGGGGAGLHLGGACGAEAGR